MCMLLKMVPKQNRRRVSAHLDYQWHQRRRSTSSCSVLLASQFIARQYLKAVLRSDVPSRTNYSIRCVESRLPRAVLTGFIICRDFGNAGNTKAPLNICFVLPDILTSILNEDATKISIPISSASVSYPSLCDASKLPVPPMLSAIATSRPFLQLTGLHGQDVAFNN